VAESCKIANSNDILKVMNKYLIAWLITMAAVQAETAKVSVRQSEAEKSIIEENSYYFVGAGLLAYIDGNPYPAIGVSEKRINVQVNGSIRKLKMSAPIGLMLKPCLSDKFIQVEDFGFSFSNLRAARAEVRMLSDLSFSQSASDAEIADIRGFHSEPVPDQELLYQEEGYRELLENQIEDNRMKEDSVVDTLNLKFTLMPNADLKKAYLVCGVSFDLPESSSNSNPRGSRMAVHFLGDLEKGVSKTVSIHKAFDRNGPKLRAV
jgi:hypothetical protein